MIRLPTSALVVLVGPSGSGKTTWADANFREGQVVSSDRLRALVGEGQHDQRASSDAFAVLRDVVERRLARRLTTVIDTLGLDAADRAEWRRLAAGYDVPCFAVGFDTDPAVCRKRNAARARKVPAKVLSGQISAWERTRPTLGDEGFDGVFDPAPVQVMARSLWDVGPSQAPPSMRFGLMLGSFDFDGSPQTTGDHLASIARRAEDAGFESLWVMDHFRQIPQLGRPWEDMPEAYTTLAYLAGVTERIRLGVMVTGVTYRNPALLGKLIATLDVLSGGRALAGLGAAWFEDEHRAYGWEFPSDGERLDLLEDALRLLPLMWGPGQPPFEGKRISIPEAMCYPRPLQERIPILVGGAGEKRTLRLVAEYADACNLFGDAEAVRSKIEVLHRHCRDVGRDPSEVTITHLGSALVTRDTEGLRRALAASGLAPERAADALVAGTVEDHQRRFDTLAEAGVELAVVGLHRPDRADAIETFAEIIARYR